MDFYMYHGRLSEDGGATTAEGEPIDDWGFEGPRLQGCIGFHCTYGVDGHFNVFFADKAARDAAFEQTGWKVWEDNALTAEFSSRSDLIKAWNPGRNRWEYFGDWGLK
jgi:hypothetical protein